MPTPEQQTLVAEILTVITGDDFFLKNKHKINDNFMVAAEDAIASYKSCINHSGRFATLMKCIPTGPNVRGWLTKCTTNSFQQLKREFGGELYGNKLCSVDAGFGMHYRNLKDTLILGF